METTVTTYELKTNSGKHIRQATQVTLPDGMVIKFTEKMPKTIAVKQAIMVHNDKVERNREIVRNLWEKLGRKPTIEEMETEINKQS